MLKNNGGVVFLPTVHRGSIGARSVHNSLYFGVAECTVLSRLYLKPDITFRELDNAIFQSFWHETTGRRKSGPLAY